MATTGKMTAQDKKWQAESDARTLAEANVIQKTKPRLRAAVKEAKVMAAKAKKDAAAMIKVAGTKPVKENIKKKK